VILDFNASGCQALGQLSRFTPALAKVSSSMPANNCARSHVFAT
jgi:hypothetical protein